MKPLKPRQAESPPARPLQAARQVVQRFVPAHEHLAEPPKIAAWKAWAIASWVAFVVTMWGLHMVGWL